MRPPHPAAIGTTAEISTEVSLRAARLETLRSEPVFPTTWLTDQSCVDPPIILRHDSDELESLRADWSAGPIATFVCSDRKNASVVRLRWTHRDLFALAAG